ncbi:MAG: SDR family oxidoreductase [Ktedonobacteraceae bacterium]
MKIAIIGATSAIAHETAKCFAKNNAEFFLVGRSAGKLETLANDLKVRGAKRIDTYTVDLADLDRHQALLEEALAKLEHIDVLLIAHGTLGDQQLCEQSVAEMLKEFTNNCTSVIALLTLFANYFEQQKRGTIAVISSVAGDRGRQSNYVYGTAKAAVTAFLQGLRGRLAKSGVHVLTIKPGLIDTPMTAELKKGPLMASAQSVGEGIYKAIQHKREVVYLPMFWLPIMFIVKSIPERVFKRLAI